MNREELLIEMQERMERGESAATILTWLDDIGYEAPTPMDRSYFDASMATTAAGLATFYLSLVSNSVPKKAALILTRDFMRRAQTGRLEVE